MLRIFTTRPGMCRNVHCKFEVNSSLTVHYTSRAVPFAFSSSVRTQIKQLLKDDIIDTANGNVHESTHHSSAILTRQGRERIVIILHEWTAGVNGEARVSIVPHTWKRNFQILNWKLCDKSCQNIEAVDPCMLYVYVLNKTLKRLMNSYLYIRVNSVMFLRYKPFKSVS
jgi:hypothetical protein